MSDVCSTRSRAHPNVSCVMRARNSPGVWREHVVRVIFPGFCHGPEKNLRAMMVFAMEFVMCGNRALADTGFPRNWRKSSSMRCSDPAVSSGCVGYKPGCKKSDFVPLPFSLDVFQKKKLDRMWVYTHTTMMATTTATTNRTPSKRHGAFFDSRARECTGDASWLRRKQRVSRLLFA